MFPCRRRSWQWCELFAIHAAAKSCRLRPIIICRAPAINNRGCVCNILRNVLQSTPIQWPARPNNLPVNSFNPQRSPKTSPPCAKVLPTLRESPKFIHDPIMDQSRVSLFNILYWWFSSLIMTNEQQLSKNLKFSFLRRFLIKIYLNWNHFLREHTEFEISRVFGFHNILRNIFV